MYIARNQGMMVLIILLNESRQLRLLTYDLDTSIATLNMKINSMRDGKKLCLITWIYGSAVYLGIYLNSHISWETHVAHVFV